MDLISLYLYGCKYFKFPVGHPVIHLGDACQNSEVMLRKEGLIKVCIPPPLKIYHSVLPCRCNGSVMFCLCRSCDIECNTDGECAHETVAEMTLTGTWVIKENMLDMQKGYEVVEIIEEYEYVVTQCDPHTGQGGLFVEYIVK